MWGPSSAEHSHLVSNEKTTEESAMQLTAGQFADIDTAYRRERITASFRDHSTDRRFALKRRSSRPSGAHAAQTLKAA